MERQRLGLRNLEHRGDLKVEVTGDEGSGGNGMSSSEGIMMVIDGEKWWRRQSVGPEKEEGRGQSRNRNEEMGE